MIEKIRRQLGQTADLLREMAGPIAEPTARAAQMLVDAVRGGHTIYVCGNGGSAAQAQHVAGELIGRFLKERASVPCVALTTDTSILTALGNDYDFGKVFERQVEGLVRPGDVLWCLSTSGNSPNVLRAAAEARRRGAKVLGMTGRTGGKMRDRCDILLCVPSDSTPQIQEGHEVLLHILCGLVEEALFTTPSPKIGG